MQTTLLDFRVFPPPAAGSNILTGCDGACTGGTTYACVALVVERIIGDIELLKICPHVGQTPVQQGTEFLQAVVGIELRLSQILPGWRLIAAQAGDPGMLAVQGAPQRFHLPYMAAVFAQLYAVIKSVGSIPGNVRFHRGRVGEIHGHTDTIAVRHLLHETVGLFRETPGIEREHAYVRIMPG